MCVLPESNAQGGDEDGMFLHHYVLLGIILRGQNYLDTELSVSCPNTFDLVKHCGVQLGLT